MLPSDVIETYGAFAGIAAIVGLAVLSLLLFTQAREIKRLREWVGRAPERDAELARRARTEAGRSPSSPPRAGAAPAGPAAAAAAAAQGRPAVGQPEPRVDGSQEPSAVPAAAAPVAPGARGPATATRPPQGRPGPPGADQPQARPDGSPPPPRPQGPPDHAQQRQPGTVPSAPPTRAAAAQATGSPSATIPPRGRRPGGQPPPPPTGESGRRLPPLAGVAVAAGVLLVLAVGVLVLTGTFSGGGSPPPQAAQPIAGAPPAQGGGEPEQPRPRGQVTVAVLNGTTSAGLAAGTADEVARAGFRPGAATDNDVQNLSASTVEYAEGYRASAREVAAVIGVGDDAINRLDRNTRVLAGPEANVVIVVGADRTQAAEGTG